MSITFMGGGDLKCLKANSDPLSSLTISWRIPRSLSINKQINYPHGLAQTKQQVG